MGGAGGGGSGGMGVVTNYGPPAQDLVTAGNVSKSPGFRLEWTLGQSTTNQSTNVTKYLGLDESTYTVRLVAPTATDCNTSLAGLPDITGIQVTGGEFYTLAAIGELAAAATNKFQVKAYVDDGVPTADKVKVRFVHTSPEAPNVDVGLGKGMAFTKVWSNVAYPMEGLVGGKTYGEVPPIAAGAISVRVANMSADVLTIEPVVIPAGAIVTAWAIGNLDNMPQPLKALVCVDTA